MRSLLVKVAVTLLLTAIQFAAVKCDEVSDDVVYRCADGRDSVVRTNLPEQCSFYENDEDGVCCDPSVTLPTLVMQDASQCPSLSDGCADMLSLYDCARQCSKLQADFTKQGDGPVENSVRICAAFADNLWSACQEETMGRIASYDSRGNAMFECVVLEQEYADAQAFVSFFLGDEYVSGTRRCLSRAAGQLGPSLVVCFLMGLFVFLWR